MSNKIIQNDILVKKAAASEQGRQFWTGGTLEDAKIHLATHPNDVCMTRFEDKLVLLGGNLGDNLVDVTNYDFSSIADSFDVGEMTRFVKEWFQQDFEKEVTVHILESGEMIHGLSANNSKLISLSRKTPALLDMAATEDGNVIGQYNCSGTLGHSGDCNSNIGGVQCLHHELTIKPSTDNDVKLYFLAGYSSKPLKAWRDSRVFWIVYDDDQRACWLVPHDLSHHAVGDTVSVTMPLVSKFSGDGMSVMHLPNPVQASLTSASPLKPLNNQLHRDYIEECMVTARAVEWTMAASTMERRQAAPEEQVDSEQPGAAGNAQDMTTKTSSIDSEIAVFDDCSTPLFDSFPQKKIAGNAGHPVKSLSPMHGPLKVLAGGCCANSRVVLVDADVVSATSEINSVQQQLSGIILVQMKGSPDIYKLQQIRWNMARAAKTVVLALTPDGNCQHLVGPMPPCYEDEENPTPVAGTPISNENVQKLVEFALSPDGGAYFGQLYQALPSKLQCEQAIDGFVSDMKEKDFASIYEEPDEEEVESSNSFTDDDFRRLMQVINTLSVSTSSPVERNGLGIRLVKFLRKMSKITANNAIANNAGLNKHVEELEFLKGWTGDNLDWAVQHKEMLESDLLKASNVKIEPQEGVEIDFGLQTKLDAAIKEKKSQLGKKIGTMKTSTINSWKKNFNAVFYPALEALMRSIGDNPRYRNYFSEINNPNMSGVIIRASQSTNKQSVASNPEDVMKIFHKLGATGFVSFRINFLQTWKTKVINEICCVDRPGEGFNDPETYVPVSHRLEDDESRPADPQAAYETDVRHQFVLPTFSRLPKMVDEDDEDDDDDDEDELKQMPVAPAEEDLAKYLLMRAEFMLRDPEQGPRQPMWQYVDWLFHQIMVIHQVPEKQAAPLAMRALGFSISRIMKDNLSPNKETMEIVASIIHAICFMSARENPPHGIIDTFFNMGKTYVPLTKEMERNPWQIEIINILSRAVDYVRPIMSAEEYVQLRANFQRAAANTVKRQIVQKLLDDVQAEAKKNAESQDDYLARVNENFYPAYREIVETIGILLEADPETFEFTAELQNRIGVLHDTITVEWAPSMRRCRVGPVREMAKALKTFSEKGGKDGMSYIVNRKPYLEMLYDQVYHIKYESCDHVLVGEVCRIIKVKTRNPDHENHGKWQARVDRAIEDISTYQTRMAGFAHGNQYKNLPEDLMLKMLNSLKADPASDNAVTFEDVKLLLSHVGIDVKEQADLKVQPGESDEKKSVFEQLRGEWWMCPELSPSTSATTSVTKESLPSVALISMGTSVGTSSNILAMLGDTYHKYKLARLFSGNLQPMRTFIKENYKFHIQWFEDTIRAAGLPQDFDPAMVQGNEAMAVYAIVQRLVAELVQDGSDRGDRARDRVYGGVVDPLLAVEAAKSEKLAIGPSS